jgi:hypothetical protein
MRFSIRELLLVTTIATLAIGWSLHAARYAALAKKQEATQAKLARVLEIARDTAQLHIAINDAGGIHIALPRDWPQSLAEQWKAVPPPSPLPPAGVEYPVMQRR